MNKKRNQKKYKKLSKFNPRNLNSIQKDEYDCIVQSNEFDEKYYVKMYNLSKNVSPVVHFIKVGVGKGYNPSPYFGTEFYLDFYPDVKRSGMNPFVHYLKYGKHEGRIPKFLTRKEILELNISKDNVIDYLTIEYSGEFDEKYYIDSYGLDKDSNAIVHFLEVGVGKGYNPSPYFDTEFYLDFYPDVKRSGMNPFVHYLKYGKREGRVPKE